MKTVTYETNGIPLSIETGRLAKLADGSVFIKQGDTAVLVTVVCSKRLSDRDFLPLFVEYREKAYAAGRIPGGFFKREGRPGEKEILTCRLIDRPMRPLFPDHWRYETQIVATVMSYDGENQPDMLAILGASTAMGLSDVPFPTQIASCRVGKVDGQLIGNPTVSQMENSVMDVVVSGSDEAVIMVEGGADEVAEQDILDAVAFGHEEIKRLNQLQRDLVAQVGAKTKREVPDVVRHEELDAAVAEKCLAAVKATMSIHDKTERSNAMSKVKEEAIEALSEQYPDMDGYIKARIGDLQKNEMRAMVLDQKVRADGRGYTDIRDITCDLGILPRAHGSALFTRGETQGLVALTLGTSRDEQMMDTIEGEHWKRYMLHYNFPSFSVGEVGPFRGPGRREIGHGVLAERALRPLIPDEEKFPYTIRLVSDILESNGSSSMASVCGGSLALMEGGVPIQRPVAGIAMGLVIDGDKVAILSDILGIEDHLGDMDFKVTGTSEGITAFQMDVKVAGITQEIMKAALAQAKQGREHILGIMNQTIDKPRDDMSSFAPRITLIKIDVEKIGEVIGPGGKIIRGIQDESGATIEIDDDGTVKIAAVDKDAADLAIKRVQDIVREPEIGTVYEGKVRSVVAFGAFIEIMPGKDGLLHVSEIAYRRIENVEDVMSVGDIVKVKVIDIKDGKVRLSKKALEDPPEGYEEPARSGGGRHGGGGGGGGRGRR